MAERRRNKDWKTEAEIADEKIHPDSKLEVWLVDLLVTVYLSEVSGDGGTNE